MAINDLGYNMEVLVKLKFSDKIISNDLEILIKLLAEQSYIINKNNSNTHINQNKIEFNILIDIIKNKLKLTTMTPNNSTRTINIFGTIYTHGNSNTDFKETLANFQTSEIAKWARVVRDSGATID